MGKGSKKRHKNKQNGAAQQNGKGGGSTVLKTADEQWEKLLTTKSAHAELYEKSVKKKAEERKQKENLEQKPKKSDRKKKACDGSQAVLIPANQPVKRKKVENGAVPVSYKTNGSTSSLSPLLSKLSEKREDGKEGDSHVSEVKEFRKSTNALVRTVQSHGRKRKHVELEESIEGVDYFVEEPDDEKNGDEDEEEMSDLTDEDEIEDEEEMESDDDEDEDDETLSMVEDVVNHDDVDESDSDFELNSDEELDEDEVDDEDESNSEDCSDSEEDEDDEEEMEDEDENEAFEVAECRQLRSLNTNANDAIDLLSFPFGTSDSGQAAMRAFSWLVSPCDSQDFFDKIFQQLALVTKRHAAYHGNLFSTKQFTEILQKNYVEYGKNINIAEYTNGVRTTLNGEGRVYAHHILDHLSGHSVQLVNPQAFSTTIWYLCDVLQEIFQCFVGANTYLTPANSAGFAPHWDDIDAFLLQVEGKKYWKVYAPQTADDALPRQSSGNFSNADLVGREPVFEGWLETGDMLYIPRGFIHQASTASDVHSLHVTVSVCRAWSWADLLHKTLPEALDAESVSRRSMRATLPLGLLDTTGVAELPYLVPESEDFARHTLHRHVKAVARRVEASLESAVDLMAREFMRTALPPLLTPDEERLSAHGNMDLDILGQPLTVNNSSEVRLIRRHGQRLLFESEEKPFVVHRYANSRVYEERTEASFELPAEWGEHWAKLYDAYPDWLQITELPKKGRKSFVRLLFDNGCLMIRNE